MTDREKEIKRIEAAFKTKYAKTDLSGWFVKPGHNLDEKIEWLNEHTNENWAMPVEKENNSTTSEESAVVNASNEKKPTYDNSGFSGDRKTADRTWEYLKSKDMIGDQPLEEWINGIGTDERVQYNTHAYLFDQGMIGDQNFKTWRDGLIGEQKDYFPEEDPNYENGEIESYTTDEIKDFLNPLNDNYLTFDKDEDPDFDYEGELTNIINEIENVKKHGFVYNDDGVTVNLKATQELIDEIKSRAPAQLEYNEFTATDTLYNRKEGGYSAGSDKYLSDQVINEIIYKYSNDLIFDLDSENVDFSKPKNPSTQEERWALMLKETGIDINDLNEEGQINSRGYGNSWRIKTKEGVPGLKVPSHPSQRDFEYDYWISPEGREKVLKMKQDYQNKRKERFDAYISGDLDLTTEELSSISRPADGVTQYLKKHAGELLPDSNLIEVYSDATNKATKNDPRFQLISQTLQEKLSKEGEFKMQELAKLHVNFNDPKQDQIEKAQEEYTKWYNKEYQTRLSKNKNATRLFQEYGVAASDFYADTAKSLERITGATYDLDGNRVENSKKDQEFFKWVDDAQKPYLDRDGKLDYNKLKDADYSTRFLVGATTFLEDGKSVFDSDGTLALLGNQIEVAFQEQEYENRDVIVQELRKAIADGVINRDMTVGEAKAVLGEDSVLASRLGFFGQDTLRSNNMNLGDYQDIKEIRLENTVEDITEDIKEMLSAEKRLSIFNENNPAGGKMNIANAIGAGITPGGETFAENFTIEGLLARGGGALKQIQNFIPGMASKTLYLAAAVNAAYGNAPATATLMKAGTMFAALGGVVEGTQTYATSYMAGVKKQMEEEFGEDGFTALEYLEALKQEQYGSHTAPALTGLAVGGVSAGSDIIMGKLGLAATNNVLGSTLGKQMMANTFGNWLIKKAAIPVANAAVAPYQEYLEEYFQGYLQQVGEKFVVAPGEEMPDFVSAFTENIDWDALSKEGDAGFAMGELFALAGLGISGSSNSNSYISQAQKIASNINMSPDGPTFSSGDNGFKMLIQKINKDNTLSTKEKRIQTQKISDIRNSAIKIPQNVTNEQRLILSNLLTEKNVLDREIKRVNDKDLSAVDLERRGIVSKEIQNLIRLANDSKKPPSAPGAAGAVATNKIISNSRQDYILAPKSLQLDQDNNNYFTEPNQKAYVSDQVEVYIDNMSGNQENELAVNFSKKGKDGTMRLSPALSQTFQNEADAYEYANKLVNTDKGRTEAVSKPQPSSIDGMVNVSNESKNNIDKLAADYKKDPASTDVESLINQYRNIALKALNYDRGKGNIDANEAVSFVDAEFESIIRRWDPSKGKLSTHINANINPKQAAFYESQIGKKAQTTSLDDERAQQVADVESTQEFDEKTQESEIREKVYASQTNQVDKLDTVKTKAVIKDEVSKDILLAASKGKNAADTAKDIAYESKKNYFSRLRKDIGTFSSQKYKNFVNSLDKNFIKSLPVAAIKRRFGKLFGIKKIGSTPTKQTSKAGKPSNFNKPVYSIPKVNNQGLQDFKDYFLGGEKRQQSLYNMLTTDFALEAIQELMNDSDFMSKLQTALGNDGITAVEFMQNIDNKLDARIKEDSSLDVISDKPKKGLQDLTKPKENLLPGQEMVGGIMRLKNKPKKEIGKKTIKLVKDNKDNPRIGKDDTYKGQISETDLDGKEKRALTKIIKDKDGKPTLDLEGNIKTMIDLDKNASNLIGKKTDKTIREVRDEIANEFLKDNPELWEIVRKITTGGGTANSLFQNVYLFEKAVKKLPLGVKKIVSAVRFGYNNAKYFTKKAYNEITNKPLEFKKQQTQNQQAYLNFWKAVEKYLAKPGNENKDWFFGELIGDTAAAGQGNLLRFAAIMGFFPVDIYSNPVFDVLVVEEHNYPQADLNESMLSAAKKGEVDLMTPVVKAGFMQGSLRGDDDTKINKTSNEDGGKLKTSQADDFYNTTVGLIAEGKLDWLPPGMAGVIRLALSGVNLNLYKSTYTGQLLAEVFGVGVEQSLRDSINVVAAQNRAIVAILTGTNKAKAIADFKADIKPAPAKEAASLKTQEDLPNTFEKKCNSPCKVPQSSNEIKKVLENSLETRVNAEKINKPTKGISVFDFDDTLAKTKEKIGVIMPDGKTVKLNAAEFALQAEQLTSEGAAFDFGEFDNVVNAKKGPLADLALKRQDKFGSGDIFVLTARPQIAAQGIKTFLDGIGLNLPLENITGLENGSPQAKAQWVLDKTAQGYNDFYFADDAKPNVQAVQQILDAVDVKSKTQIAQANKDVRLNQEFNKQIEEVTGKESFKTYSKSRAKLEGAKKDKGVLNFIQKQLTITPSAEDFMGLMYDLMGVGVEGNKHATFILDNLMKPFNKAEQMVLSAKVSVANDFAALQAKFPSLKSSKLGSNPLLKSIGIGPYTKSHAIRVYMWAKQGMEIPGLSQRDQNALIKAVEADSELKAFADNVILIQKDAMYPPPGNNWTGGDMQSDIIGGLDKGFRQKAMTEFNENVNIIFSEENMNKLESIYGTKWVEALKDSLRRMKAGSNRPVYQGGGSRVVNNLLDWLNGSVGAIMFLNMRSGLLQLTSAVNFINWGDNNMYAAAKAFANQPQYWKDVLKLMNSDYLVNRRDGLKINVNEAELVDAAKKGGMKGVLAKFLDKGFIITRIMDTLAIATGGSTFFRNRVNALLQRQNPDTGKTYTKAEAEAKAFDDFYAVAEESQQSSNPSKISQQQASLAGRVILSFQNVTMQYNRKMKKAIRNLYNRRTNPGQTQRESDLGNLSQIVYYSTIQNLVFHSLQNTLFAVLFAQGDEEEKDKTASIANGMLDSLLFGLGFGGAAISTVKNVILELAKQGESKAPKYEEAVWSVFDFSPVLDSKVRKLKSAFKSFSWNMKEMKQRGWSLENPAYLAISQVIASTTNVPLDRVMRKMMNITAAVDEETKTWQRVSLLLGWDTWSVGLPYWGLNSTIKKEEEQEEKLKASFKSDIRKLKADGYKKTMTPEKFENVIEVKSPYGTVMYYYKNK